MKLKITQTIIEVEWPDEDRDEGRVPRGEFPLIPTRPAPLVTRHSPPDEDAYYRVIELWEPEGGRV